ncbi:MAG TPA: YlzJ-like family protein [Firmicutes bacterium]|nr:YlzJ-like family protein [Bacillota bacterium]
MVLYTNQPYELIFPDTAAKVQSLSTSDGIIEALKSDDGTLHIRRLISTNPSAYLKSDYSPGTILKGGSFIDR